MDNKVKFGIAAALGAIASFFVYKTIKDINRENARLDEILERVRNERKETK